MPILFNQQISIIKQCSSFSLKTCMHVTIPGELSLEDQQPIKDLPNDVPVTANGLVDFVIRVNTEEIPIILIMEHFNQKLVSNASSLGISTRILAKDNILTVEPLDVSAHEGTQELRGYLKCIYLDYDFKNVDHAGFNAKHLLLPMRQLLDGAVERRLPLVFGPWKSMVAGEEYLASVVGDSITNMVTRSRNRSFRREVRGQARDMRATLDAKRIKLLAEIDISGLSTQLNVAVDESMQAIIQDSLGRIFTSSILPKEIKVIKSRSLALETLDEEPILITEAVNDDWWMEPEEEKDNLEEVCDDILPGLEMGEVESPDEA